MDAATPVRMPTYFLSHGGGPWPFMEGPMRARFAHLERFLQSLPGELPRRPEAVLVISGHWEEPRFTVSSAARPGMVFDYFGFPDYLYQISYPAPGSPALAHRVQGLIEGAGLPAAEDPERGFDHGTFSMLKPIYPEADMPIVQVSLKSDLGVEEHFRLGRALAPLRDEGVLILGSGFSYHNLRRWGPDAEGPSAEFDMWLRDALVRKTPAARHEALLNWEKAPSARIAHAREDHLVPLFAALGAAEAEPATVVYGERFSGHISASSFRFGADRTPSGFDLLAAA